MHDQLFVLTARRGAFRLWGTYLMLTALVLFLCLIAANGSALSGTGILLNGRASYLAHLLDIGPRGDWRYVWGGPMTLLGLQVVTFGLSAFGVILIICQRLGRGRWSRLGFLLWLSPPLIGLTALPDILPQIYPATIDDDAMAQLLKKVEARRPGLVSALRLGDKPARADVHKVAVTFARGDGEAGTMAATGNGLPNKTGKPDEIMLEDRGTIEGLRFALAEQAAARSNRAELIRLLPLELPRAEVDMPARNAFAARLEKMERVAGRSVVADGDRPELARRIAIWHSVFKVSSAVRPVMQIAFACGFTCALMGWLLGRRIDRMARARRALSPVPDIDATPDKVTPTPPARRAVGRYVDSDLPKKLL